MKTKLRFEQTACSTIFYAVNQRKHNAKARLKGIFSVTPISIATSILLFVLLSYAPQQVWAQCAPPYTLSANTPSQNVTTGIWTAPATGGPYIIQITAAGAKGGDNANSQAEGSGATMQGSFVANAGEVLHNAAGLLERVALVVVVPECIFKMELRKRFW
jgi:hypothetical protein